MRTSTDAAWCVTAPRDGSGLIAFAMAGTNAVIPVDTKITSTHLHAVNHDGTLASGWNPRQPKRIQLWNPQTGQLVTNLLCEWPARYSAISPDGRWLAISALGSTTLWSLDDFQVRHRIAHPDSEENRYPLAFSPDSRMLAAAVSEWETWLIDVPTGSTLAALPVDRLVSSLTFNATGNALAVTGEAGWFDLWNLHHLRHELATLNLDWPHPPLPPSAEGSAANGAKVRIIQ